MKDFFAAPPKRGGKTSAASGTGFLPFLMVRTPTMGEKQLGQHRTPAFCSRLTEGDTSHYLERREAGPLGRSQSLRRLASGWVTSAGAAVLLDSPPPTCKSGTKWQERGPRFGCPGLRRFGFCTRSVDVLLFTPSLTDGCAG